MLNTLHNTTCLLFFLCSYHNCRNSKVPRWCHNNPICPPPNYFFQYDNISIRLTLFYPVYVWYAHFQSCKRNPQTIICINIQNIDALKIKYITECSPHWTRTYLKKTCFSVKELAINQHIFGVSCLFCHGGSYENYSSHSFPPPTKFRECIVFSHVCLSFHRGITCDHYPWRTGLHCRGPSPNPPLDMGPHCTGTPQPQSPTPDMGPFCIGTLWPWFPPDMGPQCTGTLPPASDT